MTLSVSVVVGTYGGQEWVDLARDRAIPSAEQFGCPVIHAHGTSLHDARNLGLEQVTTERVVTLDADDELDPGFMAAMAAADLWHDVHVPSLCQIRGGRPQEVKIPRVAGHRHDCQPGCLVDGNYIVCGAMARTAMLRAVGGWEAFRVEDWQVWAKMWQSGATFQRVPAAVYLAHVLPVSRSRGMTRAEIIAVHNAVAEDRGFPLIPLPVMQSRRQAKGGARR